MLPEAQPMAGRTSAASVALVGLFALAVLAALYIAADLLTPIAFALLLSLLLSPLVRFLQRRGVPPAISAGVLVLALVGGLVFVVSAFAEPAGRWLSEAPRTVRDLRAELFTGQGHLEGIQELANEVEELATPEPASNAQPVVVKGPTIAENLLVGLPAVAAFAGIVMFTSYFLLASGDSLLRGITRLGRTWTERRCIVTVARQIQREQSRYLATVTLINLALGVVVALAMLVLEVPNPVLWGGMVALFNFAPYVGALVSAFVLTIVGLSAFNTLGDALMPPLVFLGLTIIEGQLVTPTILGQRMALSPLFVFLSVVVWGWLWGVAGALMAVPIVTSLKVLCDHVPGLERIGDLVRSDAPLRPRPLDPGDPSIETRTAGTGQG